MSTQIMTLIKFLQPVSALLFIYKQRLSSYWVFVRQSVDCSTKKDIHQPLKTANFERYSLSLVMKSVPNDFTLLTEAM